MKRPRLKRKKDDRISTRERVAVVAPVGLEVNRREILVIDEAGHTIIYELEEIEVPSTLTAAGDGVSPVLSMEGSIS